MNLKPNIGLDSSGDSDACMDIAKEENKKTDLKKKIKEDTTDEDCKKAKKKKIERKKEKNKPEKQKNKSEKEKKNYPRNNNGLSSSDDGEESCDNKVKGSLRKTSQTLKLEDSVDSMKKNTSKDIVKENDNKTKNEKVKGKNNNNNLKKQQDDSINSDDSTEKRDGLNMKIKTEDLGNIEKQDIEESHKNKEVKKAVSNIIKTEENSDHVDDVKMEEKEIIEDKTQEMKHNENVDSVTNCKFVGLDSSSDDLEKKPATSNNHNEKSKAKEKSLKKRSVRNQRRSKNTLLESSDENDELDSEEETQNRSVQENSKKENTEKLKNLITLSSSDSSDFEIDLKKRKKEASSGSDCQVLSGEDIKKKKRKLIRCKSSSDESGDSRDEDDDVDANQKSTQGESPGKGGRKNIKKIKGKGDLAEATLEAAEEEKERRRRIEERQKLFNQIFEIPEAKKLDKLVLDFDPEEKKELISVHKELVSQMKPHQAKGVKFMWDSCFESVKRLKKEKGSGCILAHCMGLGKTFQVISLVHTLFTHEETQVHTIMVVCPLSTVLNWYNEFGKWLDGVEGGDDIEIFHLTKCKQNAERARELRRWQHNGGVLIMGYEMFRNLACETSKKFKARMKKDFQETLIDPGADLIVCDEGHMLKNEATALSKAMSKVKTLRRIVLTGTPMQNNLKEYHCMVQFVKPNLLGTRKEFLNRFVNPIANGQFVDSTEADVKVMKRRAHVLHKMLEGLVQRFDYNVLTPFLPPKHEYVISVCLSELQIKLYKYYLENFSQQSSGTKASSRLFVDWQALGRTWTHPRVLKMSADKSNLAREKRLLDASDSEGSLRDFIDDGSDNTTTEESSDDDLSDASIKSKDQKKKKPTRGRMSTRATRSSGRNVAHLDSSEEEKGVVEEENTDDPVTKGEWWSELVEPKHLDDINHSAKLILLFSILKESEMIEDKVLVFSQSLFSLDLIEYFLDKIDEATQDDRIEEHLGNHQGNWSKGLDYFRLDGSTSSENRNIWCKAFNREDNPRARLFLISTRAGGLGINLTAANRVIIFDASWNPSHDVQSIFRIYRFGQKKPCYVYRFIAHGTMEEKVYDRQVAKQSMSNRVVDEQQVHRHFSMNDLNELYTFTPPSKKEDRPTPILPKDALMAEILAQHSDWIEKYHEHDSLLENVIEEELNEEERKLAWEDYENDKKGLIPPTTANTGAMNYAMSAQIEYLRQALKAKYPQKTEQELNQLLVYQVSLLMRQQQQQQQMMPQVQPSGSMQRPMYTSKNMTPEQLFNLQQHHLRMQYMQQMQMKQQAAMPGSNFKNILPKQQVPIDYQQQMLMQQQANLARIQMQQMQQKISQSLLLDQLTKPSQMDIQPTLSPLQAQLQNMTQRYEASKQPSPTVTKGNNSMPPTSDT